MSDEEDRSVITTSTSTLSAPGADVSTTTEDEDDTTKIENVVLSQSAMIRSESFSSTDDDQVDDESSDDIGDDSSVEPRLEEFMRNFEFLQAAVFDSSVEKSKIDVFLTWIPWIDSGRAGKAHIRAFFDDILPSTISGILSRSYEPNKAEIIHEFMGKLIRRAIQYARSTDPQSLSPGICDALSQVCNPFTQFYFSHGHSPASDTKKALDRTNGTFLSNEEVEALDVGDIVYMVDGRSGRIMEISPTGTEVLIDLDSDGSCWVTKDTATFFRSAQVTASEEGLEESDEKAAERLSKEPPRFRPECCPGSYVDARKQGHWYQALIIGMTQSDDLIVHFLGFSPSADALISRNSYDIAPLNSLSHGRRGSLPINTDLIDSDEMSTCIRVASETGGATSSLYQWVKDDPVCPVSSFFLANCDLLISENILNLIFDCMPFNLNFSFNCLLQLIQYLTDTMAKTMMAQFQSRTLECIRNMPADQVRNLSKATINRVVNGIYRLTRRCGSRQFACQVTEFLRTEIAKKRIESETIMQRMNGLVSLIELIDESCTWLRAPWGFERRISVDGEYYARLPILVSIPPPSLAQWCQDKKFLNGFFIGANAHCELIKRSVRLVAFLCEQGQFSITDFEVIWKSSGSEDIEIASAAAQVLGSTCYLFSEGIRNAFRSKLANLDLSKSSTLSLLSDLIWQGAQDLAESAADLLVRQALEEESEAARAALEASLKQDREVPMWWNDFRRDLIKRALARNALKHTDSLRFVRTAIESFPEEVTEAIRVEDTRAGVIEYLCQELNLIQLWMEALKENIQNPKDSDLQAQLDFLAFLVSNSVSLNLDIHLVDELWNAFPVGHTSRDIFFNWLQRVCRNANSKKHKGEARVSREVIFSIFERVQAQSEFQSMACFRLFHALLISVNLLENRIVNGDAPGEGIRLNNDTLLGYETLWRAAVEEESSDQVAEGAATVLSFFHQRLMPHLQDQVWILRKRTVDACGERIRKASEQNSFIVLSRCCSLLGHILKDAETDFARVLRSDWTNIELWNNLRPHYGLGPYPQRSVVIVQDTVKGSASYNSRRSLVVRANDSLALLRGSIANACDLQEPSDIRLFVGGAELFTKFDARPIAACMVATPLVLATRRPVDKPLTFNGPVIPLTGVDPNWLGSCADLLLRAMDHGAQSSDPEAVKWLHQAWGIIELLPTSRPIIETSVDFGEKADAVNDYLSPHSPVFLAAYFTRVVQDKLYGFEDEEARSTFVRSHNIAGRAQEMLFHLGDTCGLAENARKRDWILICLKFAVTVLCDLIKGINENVAICESNVTFVDFQASEPWSTDTLALDERASEMLLSSLVPAKLQSVLVGSLIPFLLSTLSSLRETASGASGEMPLCSVQLRDIEICTLRSFDLWASLSRIDPQALQWLQRAAQPEDSILAASLDRIVRNSDWIVVKALLTIIEDASRGPTLDICLRAMPSANQNLLELTSGLLLRAVETPSVDVSSILDLLTAKLDEQKVNEGTPFPKGEPFDESIDLCTVGLLQLIRIAGPRAKTYPRATVKSVAECVMHIAQCKCERTQSRQYAYEALSAIAAVFPEETDAEVARLLEERFGGDELEEIFAAQGWSLDPCADMRSPLGFAGLVNLGCTCYINSLVQQLWAIPSIRNGMEQLNLPSEIVRKTNAPVLTSGERRKEEDLHSLRLLRACMASLSHTSRRTLSLERFVRSFKDEFGNVTNVLEQQDAQEFYEKTCDRLDEVIRTHGNQALFRSALGVEIASELICLDDPTQRRDLAGSLEWAMKIDLPPGGGTLEKSLNDFVGGEVLTDFRWQDNGPSLRTKKTTFVTSLADTLTVHIKRFQLNWETQLTEKSNDRFEFPLELDMFPYTKEGLKYIEQGRAAGSSERIEKYTVEGRGPSYYRYRLAGILVHSGASLNAGHYYSHIRSRFDGPTYGRWYTFNDTHVSKFDIDELAEHAFGGVIRRNIVHPDTKTVQEVETIVTHNAYMLFYERCEYLSPNSAPALPDDAVLAANHGHLLACRWLDPALLGYLQARCTASPPSSVGEVQMRGSERKRKQDQLFVNIHHATIGETFRSVIFRKYLTGPAIAARSINCSTMYPGLADAVRIDLTEAFAEKLLAAVRFQDLRLLLVECADTRTRIAFSSLLGEICRTAPLNQAYLFLEKMMLTPQMIDLALANPGTSYWYALRHIVEVSEPLAIKAFHLGLVIEVLNAVLGDESPVADHIRASPHSLMPRTLRSGNAAAGVSSPNTSSSMRYAWDNAIVGAGTALCSAFDALRRAEGNGDDAEWLRSLDMTNRVCLQDMSAWLRCAGHVSMQETSDRLFSVLMRGMIRGLETETSLALKCAKIASTASMEAIPRFYDLIYQLGLDSPSIPVLFFLGQEQEDKEGFFRRIVAHRSSYFANYSIVLFIERLEDFPQMKEPHTAEKWAKDVDGFLRDDALMSALEPRDITRVVNALEVLGRFSEHRAMSAQDNGSDAECETTSTVTQRANGWQSDADDYVDDDLYSPGSPNQGN